MLIITTEFDLFEWTYSRVYSMAEIKVQILGINKLNQNFNASRFDNSG